MEETSFTLDESAELLFQQIEGVDIGKDTTLGKALSEEEKRLNACRGHLGELVHLLGTCLKDVQLVRGAETRKKFLGKFLGVLRKIGRMPDHDGKILIRFRGLKTGAESSEKVDYVVLFGHYENFMDCAGHPVPLGSSFEHGLFCGRGEEWVWSISFDDP
jgi:hypothetical protein